MVNAYVLCIYDPSTTDEELSRFLGEFGVRDTSPSSEPSQKGFSELLACVRQQGGLPIAAHVTLDGGLLTVLRGQPCIRAWRDQNLVAVQIPGPIDDLPGDKRQIVRNQNAEYRREFGAGDRLAVAVVNAKDPTRSGSMKPLSSQHVTFSEIPGPRHDLVTRRHPGQVCWEYHKSQSITGCSIDPHPVG